MKIKMWMFIQGIIIMFILAILIINMVNTSTPALQNSFDNARAIACENQGGFFIVNETGDFCQVSPTNYTLINYDSGGINSFFKRNGLFFIAMMVFAIWLIIKFTRRNL